MVKIISIVGKSNSGKTTLLEKLIKNLSGKGYRIGTIKHNTRGFEIDYPGKDSYRHFHAGSCATLIISPRKLAFIKRLDKPAKLDAITENFFKGFDLIITEGFKRENKPKIELVRAAVAKKPLCKPRGHNLIALVTDLKIDGYPQPQFKPNQISKTADFIERRFLWQKKGK
ncbi:MAG: molybdopterin-guanine dinucleotide biosynthesis protein B [Planctomycetes bacterium]|nr:molybdopterin-guanine dinucleotide biosynthesis protein B [Planctomycetota bacterium]